MTHRLLAAPCALAAALALSACGAPSGEQAGSSAAGAKKVTYLGKDSIPQDPAQRYYQQVCMACHAAGVGPELRGRELPVEAVKMFVRNGSRGMPAFPQSMIDDATLDAVARLVSTSKAAPAVPYPYAQ
ncbi:MAG TPA: cytochrome c [Sphingobium sp.]|nr:cytochrome c [Sphingobium sp.]